MKADSIAQCFIGKHLKIINSSSEMLKGIEGIVIDETKNTFEIETSKGRKKIDKNQATFEIEGYLISGKHILKQPEQRLKMRINNE